ncbi:phenylacetate--CoA ligase PaaK [Intrasporangium calvum]|uniref:Phenylacetate-coenzyme A ligase n=1 Tax=Intrasporangium calvum (strain ATCC 23552 / DSM 43043 / JCM 3097 / NBRC 12989 / NCIMB 10167 / NRRL B-3866 / 7 KIP) TaxID=710696 RepID=E6S641_INTC7|nr:phenylacetate--CoA ligase PaaK [Intrasporangium calvum]ADU46781.1 phenylacetate-CoA ligase [Intrasporangium calvum DSM 43043]AXG12048.1 phenylacetate--CoA ligase [Intrasporangium calvum]
MTTESPAPALPDHEIPTLSVDELRHLQTERLRATISAAYANVPHYTAAFDAKGLTPDDIRSLDDLRRLPFLAKADLRDYYPFGMFAVPRTEVVRIHASSGTTGRPTVVGYTKQDIDTWADLMARSIRFAGGGPGDIIHVAYGYGLFTGGLGAHYGAERLGGTVVPVSGGMTERQVQLIRDFGATVILVTPSYFLSLIDQMESEGIDPRSTSLRVGIFGAEPWTEAMRREIEERTGMDAVDIYGLSEVMGPGVAQEAGTTKDGLHLWEDHFYPEIIDPVTEEVLPDGEFGELVLTSLTRQAMPVIRYRTRDLTRLLPGTACPSMRRMEKVTGRSDDMMIIRGVNVFPTQIEEFVLAEPRLSPYFQCVLRQPGRMVELTVLVEPVESLGDADADAIARHLQHEIKTNIGTSCRVEVRAPGSIERSIGKARRIVDERPKG